MRRRTDETPVAVPDWLLSSRGEHLVDTATAIRWCEENGWRKLDLIFEARRRHDAAYGIRRDRGAA